MVAHIRLSALLPVPWTVLLIKKKKKTLSTTCDAFFISSSSAIQCVFDPFIKLFFISGVKKKDNGEEILMNVSNGCGRSPWSVTNLCPAVLLWPLRDIWMYVWFPWTLPTPHFTLFSRPVLYVLFLIPGCTSGKRPPSTPQYVPQWHFLSPAYLRERLRGEMRWIFVCVDRDYGDVLLFFFLLRRQIITGQLDPPSFPWPFVPWFCGLNLHACVHFCHTKATSTASAHGGLIPHNAKLELFALFADEYGYSLTCTNCNPHSACIAWLTRENHEAIDMGISIFYYI